MMELDIWVPTIKTAFEYQGEQHYHSLENIFGASGKLDLSTLRDQRKIQRCNELGITLVIVPCWWDEARESLEAVIAEVA